MPRAETPRSYVSRNLSPAARPTMTYTYKCTTPTSVFTLKNEYSIVMQADLEAFARGSIGGRALTRLEETGKVALHGVSAVYKPALSNNSTACTRHVEITIHYTILCPELIMMITLGQQPEEALEL